jgi:arsenate reductase
LQIKQRVTSVKEKFYIVQMQLKDRLPAMSEEEQLQLLAANGMLIKRPLVVKEDIVLVGFKEAEWVGKLN